MTKATNPIDNAIARAKEQAANRTAAAQANASTPGTELEVYPAAGQNGGAVSHYVAPRPKTLDDFQSGGFNVDTYLSVKSEGLKVKKEEGLAENVLVSIDMKKIQVCQAIKFGEGTYYKTYDDVRCAQGGSWNDAIRKAQMADPKARPYDSADLTMTVISDMKGFFKGKEVVLAPAGTILGHSLSTTNAANFKEFLDSVRDAGLIKSTVEVLVGYEPRSNAKGQQWGVLTFSLVGEYVPEQAAE